VVAADCISGLDNAGKTTIVKKIMNEDVNSVSPTLGFIIKTIEYDGYEGRLQNLRRS
jgi:GTPase SAR1 family protein